MLRITQEADNALRLVLLLAKSGERTDAPTLAQRAGIAPQFALKILRKLKQEKLVQTVKGAHGGYLLAQSPATLTVLRVVETIDGPLYINRCLENGFACSRMGVHTERCVVNRLFARVNQSVAQQLAAVTFSDLLAADACLPKDCPSEENA
jgi:Rrf2 family protein